jgi:hypothetical protein
MRERAQALRAAGYERDDNRQLRYLAQTGTDAAGAFHRRRQIRSLRLELVKGILQRLFPNLRCVGEHASRLERVYTGKRIT